MRKHEESLSDQDERDGLPVTATRQVPVSWTDYNGHMNEAHYLEAASLATDRFMQMIGADADYVAGGRSYFTVENHIRYLDEIHAGDRLTITTQVLSGQGKRLHLFHRLWRGDDTLAATRKGGHDGPGCSLSAIRPAAGCDDPGPARRLVDEHGGDAGPDAGGEPDFRAAALFLEGRVDGRPIHYDQLRPIAAGGRPF